MSSSRPQTGSRRHALGLVIPRSHLTCTFSQSATLPSTVTRSNTAQSSASLPGSPLAREALCIIRHLLSFLSQARGRQISGDVWKAFASCTGLHKCEPLFWGEKGWSEGRGAAENEVGKGGRSTVV